MKNTAISIIISLIMGFSMSGISQSVRALRQPASEKAIPKIVLNAFKTKYPDVLLQGWFVTHITYWQNDYSSDWYSSWYGPRQTVIYIYEKPNYFEVEFINNPGENSRSIYNIYGYWYETRTLIKGLPKGIHDALKTTKYNGWNISNIMEKIESPMWPDEIYRFQVSKGLKSKILRMDADGNLIQIKNLND